jgi:hypothetical protein
MPLAGRAGAAGAALSSASWAACRAGAPAACEVSRIIASTARLSGDRSSKRMPKPDGPSSVGCGRTQATLAAPLISSAPSERRHSSSSTVPGCGKGPGERTNIPPSERSRE